MRANNNHVPYDMIFVLGPTASGKTKVASSLALLMKAEVVSCDSMQIYRGMNILTQAPRGEVTLKVPHHLVRFLSVEEEYNAARYAEDAETVVRQLLAQNLKAVFAGGTGLYVKAFLDGIFSSPGKDEGLREQLRAEASELGKEHMHAKLREVDPETSEKIHPNDLRRIIRALEIHALTGKTKGELSGTSKGLAAEFSYRLFALELPREELYRRINKRVEEMVRSGLVEEVAKLREGKMSLTASKAIGVKEIGRYLDGMISLEEATEELKKNTRNYAKRQLTWFRADKRIEWVDGSLECEDLANSIFQRMVE